MTTNADVVNWLVKNAKKYSNDCTMNVNRNNHMNNLNGGAMFTKDESDAIIVDFVNYLAANLGMDLALYTKDLKGE